MRLRVTILFIACALCLRSSAWADTIHLKNGRTIVADQVRENGNHYEYDIGEDSYAIPKSPSTTSTPEACPLHSSRRRQSRRSARLHSRRQPRQ